LKDGYLRSSYQTGNIKMYGQSKGSYYIYLRLEKKNDYGNFILDENLLLENNFYLKTGWTGEADTDKSNIYKSDDFNKNTLKKLIQKFNQMVNNYLNKNSQKEFPIPLMMSNEILVKKKINLKKYLIQINLSKCDKKIIDYVEKNYPNTKINCKK
jgi:hypothetical protein